MRSFLCFVVAVQLLVVASLPCVSLAFDRTSFRIRSMGEDLSWIVEDEYTDLLRNPAYFADLNRTRVYTNFSNLMGRDQSFLGYTEQGVDTIIYYDYWGDPKFIIYVPWAKDQLTSYEGRDAPYLLAGFFPRIGVLCDAWLDKSSGSTRYTMENPSYEYFLWVYDPHLEEGTTVTYSDNDTPGDTTDDFKTINAHGGDIFSTDDGGWEFDLALGERLSASAAWGLGYHVVDSWHRGEASVTYEPDQGFEYHYTKRDVFHRYEVEEVGSNSGQEAFQVSKNSNDQIEDGGTSQTITLGLLRGLSSGQSLDVVGKIILISKDIVHNDISTLFANYDPDGDGRRYRNRYFDSYYQNESEVRQGTFKGTAWGLSGRWSARAREIATVRLLGGISWSHLTSHNVKRADCDLSVTTTGASVETTGFSVVGSGRGDEKHTSMDVGMGTEFQVTERVLLGTGCRLVKDEWKREYKLEYIAQNDSSYSGEEDESVSSTSIRLPLGLEFELPRAFRARLGMSHSFTSWEEQRGTYRPDEKGGSHSGGSRDISNLSRTVYSYGLGYSHKHFELDLIGLTDLTQLSDLLFSLAFKF